MSQRNTLENKRTRRGERVERKALAARRELNARVIAASMTAEEEPVVPGDGEDG